MKILATFPYFQHEKKVTTRYEGWYYTRLMSYYIIFHFELIEVASAHSLVPP